MSLFVRSELIASQSSRRRIKLWTIGSFSMSSVSSQFRRIVVGIAVPSPGSHWRAASPPPPKRLGGDRLRSRSRPYPRSRSRSKLPRSRSRPYPRSSRSRDRLRSRALDDPPPLPPIDFPNGGMSSRASTYSSRYRA
eukprot:17590-Pelagococcus_subviridis.AAC.19